MSHEEHEDHEGRHEKALRPLRLRSPLPARTEAVISATIGCAIEVHRTLGPGFLESIYRKAMCIELGARQLGFEAERAISVVYRDVAITGQRVDLVVEGVVVVELKCSDGFEDIHTSQLISYLRTTKLRAGLLINFKVPILRQGIKRIVV